MRSYVFAKAKIHDLLLTAGHTYILPNIFSKYNNRTLNLSLAKL